MSTLAKDPQIRPRAADEGEEERGHHWANFPRNWKGVWQETCPVARS